MIAYSFRSISAGLAVAFAVLPQKRGFHCNRCPPPSEQERPSSPREAGNAINPCDVTSEEKEYDDDCEYPEQNPIREGYVVSGRVVGKQEVIRFLPVLARCPGHISASMPAAAWDARGKSSS